MSLDINTEITLKGTKEELAAMLKVLQSFEYDNCENEKRPYIRWINVISETNKYFLEKQNENELNMVLGEDKELQVTAMGPYGNYTYLKEVKLFEALALAAPNAYFKGICTGALKYEDVSLQGELKEGKLYLEDYFKAVDTGLEYYVKAMLEVLPYEKFCELFKVDEEEFDTYSYEQFIDEAMGCEGFPEMDYDMFTDYCDASSLTEEEYEEAIKEIQDLGIVEYVIYEETEDVELYTTRSIFDVETKEYTKVKEF